MFQHPARVRRPRTAALALLPLLVLVLAASPARSRELRVPDEHPTIQSALDAALAGDRVLVGPGMYREIVSLHDSVTVSSDPPWEALIVGEVHLHFLEQAAIEGFTVVVVTGGRVVVVESVRAGVVVVVVIGRTARPSFFFGPCRASSTITIAKPTAPTAIRRTTIARKAARSFA